MRWQPWRGLRALIPAWIACALIASACTSTAPPAVSTNPTPRPGINEQLRAAFAIEDRPARLDAVLSLLPGFLADIGLRNVDDEAASSLLTDIAFSSERMTFTDRAFIRRFSDIAVVGLPDAMGLYFVNTFGEDRYPREISRWTAGLDSMDLIPSGSEAGLVYATLGVDQAVRVHYALLLRGDQGWEVGWHSDEVPEWWFNATQAQIATAPDLSKLTVVGEALGTTSVFVEEDNTPHRRFRVDWIRQANQYTQFPAMGGSDNRQNWLWQIAEPSAYASLVEFIERLRNNDLKGAALLVSQAGVVETARSYGLYLTENVYHVTAAEPDRITFQGRQGAFVAIFVPPPAGSPPETKWLITNVSPLGAVAPTPTP